MSKKPDFEGFARAVMDLHEFVHDIDAMELSDLAVRFNMIKKIEGGFNPDEHIDDLCYAEEGDDWFELNFTPDKADKGE